MEKLKLLWTMYYTFLKIGGFTLGGGYAMIPIIQREAVDVKRWVKEDEMTDIIALAQSMPGVVGINTATALGVKVAGVAGAITASAGMVTTSIVVIVLIAAVFDAFYTLAPVQWAFTGIRAAVAALMAVAVIRLLKSAVKDWFQLTLFIGAALCILIFHVPPQYVLLGCALLSITVSLLGFMPKRKAGGNK